MSKVRGKIIRSILRFLTDKRTNELLDSEQQESLLVAYQCLEATFELDLTASAEDDITELYSLFNSKPEVYIIHIKRVDVNILTHI